MNKDVLETISEVYCEEKALQEATRCLMCEDAPCEQGCPASVPVREFIRNIRFKNYKGAYHLIVGQNPLGVTCARVCNAIETCKGSCTSNKLIRPIEIDKLQQFVCDKYVGKEKVKYNKSKSTGKRVAVIGAGPGGLSVAQQLTLNGVDVTVYEREKFIGGIMQDGIPSYRLPKQVVDAEVKELQDFGIKFELNHRVEDLKDLEKDYDALVLAIGLEDSKLLKIPGIELPEIYSSKKILRADKLSEDLKLGKNVLVLGGGNSAVDAAQAAFNLSAKNVTLAYRRSEKEMPAWSKEIKVAKELGVNFIFLSSPVEILGDQKVSGVKFSLMKPEGKSQDGRTLFVPLSNTTFILEADSIIIGVGEEIKNNYLKGNNVEIQVDNCTTNNSKVFSVGDLVLSNKSVVHAVGNGKKCATEILKYLNVPQREFNIKQEYYKQEKVDISTTFCNVKFINPFVLAAAPPTDDLDMLRTAFKAGWAGAVLKTTSVESNCVPLKYPMMTGIKHGHQNLMGLGNIDLISEHHIDVVEKRVEILKKEFPDRVIIASIMGATKEDWQSLVQRLEKAGVDIIECSFSCPQGTLGSKPGFMLGQDPKLVKQVAGWIKSAAKRVPVVIKITPQVTDIIEIAKAVKESGADAICASNSIPALMGINLDDYVPYPNVGGKSTYSGLTGAAIKPITLRNIAEIKRSVDIPITGTGGPMNWQDAIELMLVGASNVQFCTAVMYYGFDIINDLCSGLTYFMKDKKITSVSELVGRSLQFIGTHDELNQAPEVRSVIDQDKCVQCGACVVACRDGGHQAIFMDDTSQRTVKVDRDKCVGCAFCLGVCPVEGCLNLEG